MIKNFIHRYNLTLLIFYVIILTIYSFFSVYSNINDEPFFYIHLINILHHIIINEAVLILSFVIIIKTLCGNNKLYIKIIFCSIIILMCSMIILDMMYYISDILAADKYIEIK